MKQYRIVYGAYVRTYAEHIVHAEDDEAARKGAIRDFALRSADFQWLDANYDNLALPSIVNIQIDDPPADILDGYDFAITPADARQYAAEELLTVLVNLMPHIENKIDQRQHSGIKEDWLELHRKAADARAAIAAATAHDHNTDHQQTSDIQP